MPRLHLLRVFCAPDGSGGNPLAVFLDGSEVPPSARQAVARELGLSETVFVDDAARGAIRIFTPATEVGFAGHPAVGTSWLLARERAPVDTLRLPPGEVSVRYEDGLTHVSARPEWGPPFSWEQLGSPDDVDALPGPPQGQDTVGFWAWIDAAAGIVRARVFPVSIGIDEDEATGSAALLLCRELGRPIVVRQGRGSRLAARPLADGFAEVGGTTVLDETRDYALPAQS